MRDESSRLLGASPRRDAHGGFALSSFVACCTTADVAADAHTLTLSTSVEPSCLGSRARETLAWPSVRLVSASVGARSVARLLRATALILAVAVCVVTATTYTGGTIDTRTVSIDVIALAWVFFVSWVLYFAWWLWHRHASFGAWTARGDQLVGPLETMGMCVVPHDAEAAMSGALPLWVASRGGGGRAGDGSGISSTHNSHGCGGCVTGRHTLSVHSEALGVITRQSGCGNLDCVASRSEDAFHLREVKWVGMHAGNVVCGSSSFPTFCCAGSLAALATLLWLLFLTLALPISAFGLGEGTFFDTILILTAGVSLPFACCARGLTAAATCGVTTTIAGLFFLLAALSGFGWPIVALFLPSSLVLLIRISCFGPRTWLSFGVLDHHAPEVFVSHSRAPELAATVIAFAFPSEHGASAGGGAAAAAPPPLAHVEGAPLCSCTERSVTMERGVTTITEASGLMCCDVRQMHAARTRDIEFVHVAGEDVSASVVAALALAGAATVGFCLVPVYLGIQAFVYYGVVATCALYALFKVCTRQHVLVLGTPFGKPATAVSRAAGACGGREVAGRFLFAVPFSTSSEGGDGGVDGVADDFARVWAAAGGVAVQFAAPGSVVGADKRG